MNWFTPSTFVGLHGNAVHIWWIDVERFLHLKSNLFTLLSTAEQRQAARLIFADDRHRYVVIHGICRLILGRYLACPPQTIRYGEEQNGKPILIQEEEPTVHFNLSHSSTKALFALSFSRVGVDVERMKETVPLDELVPHFMSVNEQQSFARLDQTDRVIAFYRCWTRKEAYVKAIGQGLFYPIKQIDVSISPRPALRDQVHPAHEQQWRIIELPQIDDYMLSLVTENQPFKLSLMRFTENQFPIRQKANSL